jgi:hypothetical protein
MKNLFILFLLPAYVGFGQTPASPSSGCSECSDGFVITSISQLKDVKETDAFYMHVQSLAERYGINVAPCNKTTFGGRQVLTNAALAQMLSSSLQQISELKEAAMWDKNEADKQKIKAKIKLNGFDLYKHKYTSIGEVKDVKATDCYYRFVKVLLEEYKIDITHKTGLLDARKPANGKNSGVLLKQVFGIPPGEVSKFANLTITKGEFAILLNEALDRYNEMMAAAIAQ